MQGRGVDARDSCDDDELSDFLSLDGVHRPCDGGCCAAAVMDCIVISQSTIHIHNWLSTFRALIDLICSLSTGRDAIDRDRDLQHRV